MTVRRILTVLAALLALSLGAGCSDRGEVPQIAELDEPFYVQGVQLKKQGRYPEALTAFLKVIEKRGERGAAESQLEAGLIYLNHTKDPVLAYYYFRKYLELQPNSRQAPLVRGQMEAALREFARRIPGRPLDDQSVRIAAEEEVSKLRRENEELRAELATLRGGGAIPVRSSRLIQVPPVQDVPSAANTTPITADAVTTPSTIPSRTAITQSQRPTFTPLPLPASQPQAKAPAVNASRGRSHAVREKDSLWKIAREHYGAGVTGAQVRGIYEANRNQMRDEGDLRPGMTLRIP